MNFKKGDIIKWKCCNGCLGLILNTSPSYGGQSCFILEIHTCKVHKCPPEIFSRWGADELDLIYG